MTLASRGSEARGEIIEALLPVYAKQGHEGVSMRQAAAVAGALPEEVRRHFPDERQLYLAVMEYAFRNVAAAAVAVLREAKPPMTRLNNFCFAMAESLSDDTRLMRLLMHERLTNDPESSKLLYERLFAEPFQALIDTVREMETDYDPLLLALSVVGLLNLHLELGATRRLLPGWRYEHDWPETLSLHVTSLLEAVLCK